MTSTSGGILRGYYHRRFEVTSDCGYVSVIDPNDQRDAQNESESAEPEDAATTNLVDASIPTDGISAEDLFAELGLDDAGTTNLVDVSSKLVVATEDAAGGDTEIG